METKPAQIFRFGARAAMVAVLGVVVPFAAGWLLAWLWGKPQIEAIFIGTALVATSVGITARVLGQMGLLNLETSRIILAAAVIDDVLGLIVLAIASSVATGDVNLLHIGTTAAAAIAFTILVALVGPA
ncbi:MAG TPA: cation:proton antiporter, partial [Blastocatellia bacterium]|nr:cation:proton antiporter [Blastocatellia bacterium]